jgi:5'(3')-deoxyribonucleotidase
VTQFTVGVDIDDTSLDLVPTWLETYNAITGDDLHYHDIVSWGVQNFAKDPETIFRVLETPGLYDYVGVVEGAAEGLRELRKNYRVVFVTATESPSMKEKRKCLVRHGLEQTKTVEQNSMVAKDKTLARVHLLIDDNAANVEAFPGPAILFDRPWNSNWKTPKDKPFPVVRCSSWKAIPSFVDVLLDYAVGKTEGRWP